MTITTNMITSGEKMGMKTKENRNRNRRIYRKKERRVRETEESIHRAGKKNKEVIEIYK